MAPSSSGAHSRPVRQSRTKVHTYHEETTSEDEQDFEQLVVGDDSRHASVSLRPRGAREIRPSYREQSTDSSSTDLLGNSDDDTGEVIADDLQLTSLPTAYDMAVSSTIPSTTGRSQHTRPRAPTRPKQSSSKNKRPSQKGSRDVGKSPNKRVRADMSESTFMNSGVIPPWQTLPYQVLLEVFLHVSHQLVYDRQSGNMGRTKWLLGVALLCRSFHEPALAALYYSPPLVSGYKSHGLLSLLSIPQGLLSMNYAAKIKELHVDAEMVLSYKSGPTLGYFDLGQLICKTPRVQTLRLYHHEDFIIGIPSWDIPLSKWNYPPSLFSAIAESGLILRSWDWNGRFLATIDLIPFMLEIHQLPAFQSLKKLRLVHLMDPVRGPTLTREGVVAAVAREAALATALKALPELETLEFMECSLVSGPLLPQLPSTISSLTLCNCDSISSSHISKFLKTHGAQLRQLNLSHNRHLNLSFASTLARDCPKLEKFRVDISIHDFSSYHNTSPHFSSLFSHAEVPTWPSTLRELELIQLRRWNADLAETFFQSLINAAPNLPDLRRLEISAILQIGWRDRAHFRERWISRLEDVFLRRSMPPNPDLRSLRKRSLQLDDSTICADNSISRLDGENDTPTQSKRQSSRLARRKAPEATEKVDLSPSASLPRNERLGIQGMCDIVSIRIDNQRPTETQFNEADFLDDELSGDEEWNGDDYEAGGFHAW